MITGRSGAPVTTTLFLLITPVSAIAPFSYSPGSADQPAPAGPGPGISRPLARPGDRRRARKGRSISSRGLRRPVLPGQLAEGEHVGLGPGLAERGLQGAL